MLDLQALKAQDLRGLSPQAMARAAEQMLAQLLAQSEQIARQDHEIRFKDARIVKITFELARLKAWKFGAKTEAMIAEQRRLFKETMAEDEASLQAQLEALQAHRPAHEGDDAGDAEEKRRRHPKRQLLPEHLRRVDHVHEPNDTNCPSPGCGRPMVRVREDVSKRLDIIPAASSRRSPHTWPRDAWPMCDDTSTSWPRAAPVRWRPRCCDASRRSTGPSASSQP
ncbi:MAG TPA: hypothetical protein VMR43_07635 [Variovorax sp.]|nr:hypothetical protein [Variovorax sp.]